MSKAINSLYNMRLLDDLARKDTSIHRLHPLVKLITTVVYLAVVISFERYEVNGLIPFVFYPLIILMLSELPPLPILKRVLMAAPFIIGVGILNPVFDNHTVSIGRISISRGWITFLSITIKSGLTVTSTILLIATTGMDKIAAALRMLKIPRIFVLQLLLTYRYISVLIEEVLRMSRAYSLRAPGQKGIQRSAWGSFAGQLLLRTFDRAQRVYESMALRGFNGEFNTGKLLKISVKDILFLAAWSMFFVIARFYNIPMIIGSLFTGVIK